MYLSKKRGAVKRYISNDKNKHTALKYNNFFVLLLVISLSAQPIPVMGFLLSIKTKLSLIYKINVNLTLHN